MSASWIQDRRRKQAAGYDEKTGAALADIMGGLQASLAVPENERRRKLAEELAAGELGAKKSMAESTLLRAKTADKAAEESLLRRKGEETTRTEAAAAKKAADDAKAAKMDREESLLRRKEAVLDVKRATEGGLSRADLEKRAAALGVPPEQLLAEADMLNRDEMLAEDETKAKTAASEALAAQREAAAAKAARGPGPAKPMSAKERALTRKAEAEATLAERLVAGGGPKDKVEAGTIKEVGELDAATRGIQDLERRNPGVGTGFFRAVQNSIAQTFGIDDPKATKYRADIANLSNEIISRLSGANVPPAEMERIAQGLPAFSDDDAAFTEKLRATKERVDRARKGLVGAAKAANRDTTGLEAIDPAGDVAAVPPAQKKATELTDEELMAEMAAEQ